MDIVGKIFQFILIGVVLFALLFIGGMVFFITLGTLVILAIFQWIRSKFASDTEDVSSPTTPHSHSSTSSITIIDAEFEEIEEIEENSSKHNHENKTQP